MSARVATLKPMSDSQALIESIREDVRVISDGVDVVTHLARKHSRQINEMNKRTIRVEVRLDEHGRRLDRIESKLDDHDQRLDRIEGKLDDHDRRFDRIDGDLADIRSQLSELTTMKGQLAELTTMKGQLAEILDRLAS